MSRFWRGAAFAVVWFAFWQDLMGMEKYIQVVRAEWINIPFWVWIPFIILLALPPREKKCAGCHYRVKPDDLCTVCRGLREEAK
jgi:hypothetical protein